MNQDSGFSSGKLNLVIGASFMWVCRDCRLMHQKRTHKVGMHQMFPVPPADREPDSALAEVLSGKHDPHFDGCSVLVDYIFDLPGLWLSLVAIANPGMSQGVPGDILRTLWRAWVDGAPQACSIPLLQQYNKIHWHRSCIHTQLTAPANTAAT